MKKKLKAWQLVKKGWCQSTLAITSNGEDVWEDSPRAVAWCAMGAIRKAYPGERWSVLYERLRPDIGKRGLASWNDNPKRTQAEVVAALKKAGL